MKRLALAAFGIVLSVVSLSSAGERHGGTPQSVARAFVAELNAKPSLWPDTGEKEIRKRFAQDIDDRDGPRVGLQALLSDPDAKIREDAANLLGRLGDKQAAGTLIALLKDKSKDVRSRVALALGQIDNRVAVEPLIVALKNDSSGLVRMCAAQAFGEMPDRRALPALIEALKTDKDSDVRRDAARALGKIGGEEAIAALRKALVREDGQLRAECEDALDSLKSLELPLPDKVYSELTYERYDDLRKRELVKREVRKGGKVYFEYNEWREVFFPGAVGWLNYRSWYWCDIPQRGQSERPANTR